MKRGEIWWGTLPPPFGSEPAYRRPLVVIQANVLSETAIRTVMVAVMTSNLRLAELPGNVLVTGRMTRLRRPSVINVSQLFTLDRSRLSECIGRLSPRKVEELNAGLRRVLAL